MLVLILKQLSLVLFLVIFLKKALIKATHSPEQIRTDWLAPAVRDKVHKGYKYDLFLKDQYNESELNSMFIFSY